MSSSYKFYLGADLHQNAASYREMNPKFAIKVTKMGTKHRRTQSVEEFLGLPKAFESSKSNKGGTSR